MHRVETKQKQAILLRVLAYSTILVLSVVATVVLLYIALGYRFDGKSGHVVRSGLLLVDSKPESGSISINNKIVDNATPGRFVLEEGRYELKLTRSKYRDWYKQVKIEASGVREVNYPLFIPKTLSAQKLFESANPDLVSQSQDRKLLLTHYNNQGNFEVITLDPEKPERTKILLSNSVKREGGAFGTFTVVEWALDNKHVLLRQTLPSGAMDILSLDVTKPEEIRSVREIYGDESPDTVHYVGGDTDVIYGLRDGALATYRLDKKERKALLSNVRTYEPYASDTILFERLSGDSQSQVGIWKDGSTAVVATQPDIGQPSLLRYANYDDHYYFVVGTTANGGKLSVYRDPLKTPILATQLPFWTRSFVSPSKIDFSGNSQFILVQNSTQILVYDLEDREFYNYDIPVQLAEGMRVRWINDTHLQAQGLDGANVLFEYDGQNKQSLLPSIAGRPVYFANNYKTFYRYNATNPSTSFDVVNLVAD